MDFFEFQRLFPTKEKVIQYFIKIRYPKGAVCNRCGSQRVSQRSDRPRFFQCNQCNDSFSIFKETVFEKTTTDLRKWMYAIHLFLNAKKGVSGLQLQREIKVTYKTAWRMLKQIRQAMGNKESQKQFEAIIEMDETYVGGKPRKGNKYKEDDDEDNHNKRGRGSKKTPVVGVLERNGKKVHARVALPNKEGKKLSGKQLLAILNEVCKGDATIMTDQFRAYNLLKNNNFIHLKVDHTKEYVSGNVHCNSMESFWAILKRGVYGIYHQISVKYLQSYVNEFCFRYNNRDVRMAFDLVLQNAIGK